MPILGTTASSFTVSAIFLDYLVIAGGGGSGGGTSNRRLGISLA